MFSVTNSVQKKNRMIESLFVELLSELAGQAMKVLAQKALEHLADRLVVKGNDAKIEVNSVCFTLISFMNIFF